MCPQRSYTHIFHQFQGVQCIYLIFLHRAMCPQHTLIFSPHARVWLHLFDFSPLCNVSSTHTHILHSLMPGFAMQPWAKPRWKTAITRHLSCHRCIWPKPNKPINFNNFRCSCHMLINVGFSRPTFAYSLLHFFVLPKYQNPPNQQNQPIICFNKAFLCPVRTVW